LVFIGVDDAHAVILVSKPNSDILGDGGFSDASFKAGDGEDHIYGDMVNCIADFTVLLMCFK